MQNVEIVDNIEVRPHTETMFKIDLVWKALLNLLMVYVILAADFSVGAKIGLLVLVVLGFGILFLEILGKALKRSLRTSGTCGCSSPSAQASLSHASSSAGSR